ncbi:hypothetical protein BGZ50_009624, partial [Haplosporangium sp. Z 11]
MSSNGQCDNKTPRVLIVGAGLGGLMLGMILEKAGIDYCIFERAAKVKPLGEETAMIFLYLFVPSRFAQFNLSPLALGSAMTLGPAILPVFEQLGLIEEFNKVAMPLSNTKVHNAAMDSLGSIVMKDLKKVTGFDNMIFA